MVDYQGQRLKDIMDSEKDKKILDKGQLSVKGGSLMSFFDGSHLSLFIFRKTQKLTAAIFMLTELFEKDNPFRTGLRNSAADLLSCALHLAVHPDIFLLEKGRLKSSALETMMLLESANFAGLVSSMNLKVFQDGYLPVFSLLNEERNAEPVKPVVPDGFFNVPEPFPEKDKGHKGHYKGQSLSYEGEGRSVKREAVSLKESKSAKLNHDSPRAKTVLSVVRKGGRVSVKDVAAVVSGVSEKTLQRELLSLVSQGVLKKEGERRWSRYSLT